MEIILGKKYRDQVTGFEGIATARHEYMNGCVRISITPTELREGKPIETQSFDVEQIQFVDDGIRVEPKRTGGPGDVPRARFEPTGR